MDYLYLINEKIKTEEPSCHKKLDHLYKFFSYKNITDERVEICYKCGITRFLIVGFYSMNGFYTF